MGHWKKENQEGEGRKIALYSTVYVQYRTEQYSTVYVQYSVYRLVTIVKFLKTV